MESPIQVVVQEPRRSLPACRCFQATWAPTMSEDSTRVHKSEDEKDAQATILAKSRSRIVVGSACDTLVCLHRLRKFSRVFR